MGCSSRSKINADAAIAGRAHATRAHAPRQELMVLLTGID